MDAFYTFLNDQLKGASELKDDIQSCWNKTTDVHMWVLPDGHTAYVPVKEPEDKKIEIDELEHRSFTHRAYIVRPSNYGISLAANITHSIDGLIVREMYRRMSYTNEQREHARNFIDSFGLWTISDISNFKLDNVQYKTADEYLKLSVKDYLSMSSIEQYVMTIVLESIANTSAGELLTIHDCFGSRPKYMNAVRKHYNTILFQIACSDLMQNILRQITGNPKLNYIKVGTLHPIDILDANYALS